MFEAIQHGGRVVPKEEVGLREKIEVLLEKILSTTVHGQKY